MLRRIGKGIAVALAAVVVLVLLALGYVLGVLPRTRAVQAEPFPRTAAQVARGDYLFNHVSGCADCHSEHVDTFGWPVKAGTLGSGQCLDAQHGYEGGACFPNITPDAETGVGKWSDDQLARAIREGVDRDGHALFWLMMPFPEYRELSDEDVRSLVAYLRTLPPVSQARARVAVAPMFKVLRNLQPQPVHDVPGPAAGDSVQRGRYLAKAARCIGCHGEDLSGGDSWNGWRNFVETPANLTPDVETGLGGLSKEQFIGRFKAYAGELPSGTPLSTTDPAQALHIVMPWVELAGMTEADLGDIYDYLRTVPKVSKKVTRFSVAQPQQ